MKRFLIILLFMATGISILAQSTKLRYTVDVGMGVFTGDYDDQEHSTFYTGYTGSTTNWTDVHNTWADGGGGSYLKEISDSDEGDTEILSATYSAASWPEPIDGDLWIWDLDDGWVEYPHNGGPVINQWHTDMQEDSGEYSQTTDAHLTLWTGGSPGSTKKHLIGVSAGAMVQDWLDYPWTGADSYTTTPDTIGGQKVGPDGCAYFNLSDNSEQDITPEVKGEKDYSFYISIGYPKKYNSHFTVFVDMPDSPPGRDINEGDDYGHVWWKFDTDAPDDAVSKFIQPTDRFFLGKEVGYYPIGDILWYNLGATDGQLKVPETDGNKTVTKPYDIGFSDLTSGLDHTLQLYISPGEWDPLIHNCVHATWGAGNAAGIILPSTSYPEEFGYEIQGIIY